MNLQEFKNTLSLSTPPAVTPLLQALWHDAKGDWATAHNIAQDVETPEGSWMHAYLHRKEGDPSNARYWYQLAKQPEHKGSLEEEWNELAQFFLTGHSSS